MYAFEPEPIDYQLLEENVRINGYQSVVLERVAVSDVTGKVSLYRSQVNEGNHRIFDSGESRHFIGVESIRLDNDFGSLDRKIDVIKNGHSGCRGVGGPRDALSAEIHGTPDLFDEDISQQIQATPIYVAREESVFDKAWSSATYMRRWPSSIRFPSTARTAPDRPDENIKIAEGPASD